MSSQAADQPTQPNQPIQPIEPQWSGEAIPLPEQGAKAAYQPRPEVEALTPKTPEVLPPGSGPVINPATPVLSGTPIDNPMLVVPAPPGSPEGVGGILISPEAMLNDPRVRGVMDGLTTMPAPRVPSRELFQEEIAQQKADDVLLKQFVTNQRLRDLWHQIDALQEEVIQNVQSDRTTTDNYQKDLLYASSLLLQSAGRYDEAREIIYRIRGDLNRERKVTQDTHRYQPLLLIYYAVWFVIVILLSRFDSEFRAMIPDSLPILKLAFAPMLFAILGALFNGVMALNQHATISRDFDPQYTSWYLINPFIGGLLGLIVFIFFVVTGTSFTPNLVSDPSVATTPTPVIWLLAFIVGWQQNTAVQLLNGFLKMVSPASKDQPQQDRPPLTPPPTTPPSSK